MKKAVIILLAMLTFTSCSNNPDPADDVTDTAISTIQNTTGIASEITTAEVSTTEILAENNPDFSSLRDFLCDISVGDYGVYIFDYNGDEIKDAMAFSPQSKGIECYVIDNVFNPTIEYELSSPDNLKIYFDSV